MVADAHATGLPPASADLVLVAQALHWWVSEFEIEMSKYRI